MRLRPAILLTLLAAVVALPGAARAQLVEDVSRCRNVDDPARRLACYDQIPLSSAAPRSKYEVVSLADMLGYRLSYRGRLVEVRGWLEPDARFFSIRENEGDPLYLPVDFDALTRRELQAFRQTCGTGCRVIVQGRVGPVNFTTGIVADTLVVTPG